MLESEIEEIKTPENNRPNESPQQEVEKETHQTVANAVQEIAPHVSIDKKKDDQQETASLVVIEKDEAETSVTTHEQKVEKEISPSKYQQVRKRGKEKFPGDTPDAYLARMKYELLHSPLIAEDIEIFDYKTEAKKKIKSPLLQEIERMKLEIEKSGSVNVKKHNAHFAIQRERHRDGSGKIFEKTSIYLIKIGDSNGNNTENLVIGFGEQIARMLSGGKIKGYGVKRHIFVKDEKGILGKKGKIFRATKWGKGIVGEFLKEVPKNGDTNYTPHYRFNDDTIIPSSDFAVNSELGFANLVAFLETGDADWNPKNILAEDRVNDSGKKVRRPLKIDINVGKYKDEIFLGCAFSKEFLLHLAGIYLPESTIIRAVRESNQISESLSFFKKKIMTAIYWGLLPKKGFADKDFVELIKEMKSPMKGKDGSLLIGDFILLLQRRIAKLKEERKDLPDPTVVLFGSSTIADCIMNIKIDEQTDPPSFMLGEQRVDQNIPLGRDLIRMCNVLTFNEDELAIFPNYLEKNDSARLKYLATIPQPIDQLNKLTVWYKKNKREKRYQDYNDTEFATMRAERKIVKLIKKRIEEDTPESSKIKELFMEFIEAKIRINNFSNDDEFFSKYKKKWAEHFPPETTEYKELSKFINIFKENCRKIMKYSKPLLNYYEELIENLNHSDLLDSEDSGHDEEKAMLDSRSGKSSDSLKSSDSGVIEGNSLGRTRNSNGDEKKSQPLDLSLEKDLMKEKAAELESRLKEEGENPTPNPAKANVVAIVTPSTTKSTTILSA